MAHRLNLRAATLVATVLIAWGAVCASAGAESDRDLFRDTVKPADPAEADRPPREPPAGRVIQRVKPQAIDPATVAGGQAADLALVRSTGAIAIQSPELVDYIEAIVRRLFAKAPVPPPVHVIRIRASDVLRAQASEYGLVYIYLGLMTGARNEDEIAFVVAHELGHVLLGHHKQNRGDEIRDDAYRAAMIAFDVASATGVAQRAPTTAGRATLAFAGFDLASEFAVAHFTRENEDEADILALDLMVAAGYNPIAASDVMERIPEFEGPLDRRAPDQEQKAADEIAEAAKSGGVQRILGAITRKLAESLDRGLKQLRFEAVQRNRTAEERRQFVAVYLDREYPDLGLPPYDTASLDKVRRRPAVAQMIAQHEAAAAAEKSLRDGKFREAEKPVAVALRNQGERQVMPAYVQASFLATKGDLAGSLKVLDNVRKFTEPALNVAVARVHLLEKSGRLNDAILAIDEAAHDFPESPLVAVYQANLYHRAGRSADAAAMINRCRIKFARLANTCTTGP